MAKALFSQVCVCLHEGGTPSPSHNTCTVLSGGTPVTGPRSLPGGGFTPVPGRGYPIPDMGVSQVPPGQDWMGYPHPRQNSRRSTCYAAGVMPLASMQEDCLVLYSSIDRNFTISLCFQQHYPSTTYNLENTLNIYTS